ncbi:glycosyl transferase family 2 [Hymenobacter roseosalivarius DSM 11622]|uniref:Glycosyl transferase family 2 n=1 Tax=Hymenobacter roseosalivarius DSM 11622 TaxID=645990 RepID=A0A1W1V8U3_9BACT|nr:glycosyltransferase family 2 protein [Hymenobacter roseosalivarius]SMB89471.1 glycosyl transferase family 2 [Hymenobacter roseosalivarius DSM 11622]
MPFAVPSLLPKTADKSGWPWSGQLPVMYPCTTSLPKISIITPSFNQGIYLEETIQSIVAQNYPNYELIIIDAGSTDNTLEVIHKYEPWITYWVSEKDRGQSHAISKGLDQATGDIINWLNSDDLLAPGAFYALAEEFDLNRYDVLCGYCDYFLEDLNHLDKRNERMGVFGTVGDTLLKCHINQPSTFFKASVIKELNIDEQFHYTMDVDLWYRYLLRAGHNRIQLSDKLLTYFRLHGTSKSVAEHTRFQEDLHKVFYNVMYSLNQPASLMHYMSLKIAHFERFVPKRYKVGIPEGAINIFIRTYAWQALCYYNQIRNYQSAYQCLEIARRHGKTLDIDLLRQIIKLSLLSRKVLK